MFILSFFMKFDANKGTLQEIDFFSFHLRFNISKKMHCLCFDLHYF